MIPYLKSKSTLFNIIIIIILILGNIYISYGLKKQNNIYILFFKIILFNVFITIIYIYYDYINNFIKKYYYIYIIILIIIFIISMYIGISKTSIIFKNVQSNQSCHDFLIKGNNTKDSN